MRILSLSIAQLKSRPFNSALSICMFALGMGIISLLLHFERYTEEQVVGNLGGVDLVVGAKGSPLQLIMSSVLHVDNPTGNISLEEANKIKRNRMVKSTIPIALGDNYRGYRIVGTSREYVKLYEGKLKTGKWNKKVMEVMLGSSVAETTGLKIGEEFSGVHGFLEEGHRHDDHKYVVSGILESTGKVLDRLIITDVESLWYVHDHDDCEHHGDHNDHEKHEDCEHHDHQEDDRGHEKHEDHKDHEHHEDCEHHDHDKEHKDQEKHEDHKGHKDHDHHEGCEHHEHDKEHEDLEKHEDHKDHEHHEGCEHHDHDKEHKDQEKHEDHKGHKDHSDEEMERIQHKIERHEDLSEDEMKLYDQYKGNIGADKEKSDKEITALLVFYRNPMAAATLSRTINQNTNVQSASPIIQLNRLMSLLGYGFSALNVLAWVIIVFSGINILIHLLNKLNQEIYDIALLRSLGVGRIKVLFLLLGQSILLAVSGWIVGMVLVRVAIFLIGLFSDNAAISMQYGILGKEIVLLVYALGVGLASAIIPSIKAYRTDIHFLLNKL